MNEFKTMKLPVFRVGQQPMERRKLLRQTMVDLKDKDAALSEQCWGIDRNADMMEDGSKNKLSVEVSSPLPSHLSAVKGQPRQSDFNNVVND